jgi:hypothetical protein
MDVINKDDEDGLSKSEIQKTEVQEILAKLEIELSKNKFGDLEA